MAKYKSMSSSQYRRYLAKKARQLRKLGYEPMYRKNPETLKREGNIIAWYNPKLKASIDINAYKRVGFVMGNPSAKAQRANRIFRALNDVLHVINIANYHFGAGIKTSDL